MRVRWLSISERDLVRLYDFLKDVNPRAAARSVQSLLVAVRKLPDHPRVGAVIDRHAPREVRALHVNDYEVRYEIVGDTIVILRIWHTREDR
jgi:plasmid stabilization system protein ParE